ncbi:6275_t:CDS:2, partial [Diversispora eburnea]
WLDKNFPHDGASNLSSYEGKKREDITELNIRGRLLGGSLKLEGFNNLEEMRCDNNYLTDIKSLLSELNPEKIKTLEDYEEGIANRFVGSLQPLRRLTKLKQLFINNTDIDRGLEYLPEDLESLYCGDCAGLRSNEVDFAAYLETKKVYNKIERLNIADKGLEGSLDLSVFKSLTDLNCSKNQITSLDLTGLIKLENLSCNDNLIEEFDLTSLNPEKLTSLNIKNNNLSEQNIKIFDEFTKLKQLSIGNDNKEKIDKGEYNHFSGSLSSLKGLTDLENLYISNTDIDEIDIEKLPKNLSIGKTYCSTEERPKSKVEKIQAKLYSHLTKKYLNEMYPDKSAKVLDNLYSKGLKDHLDLSNYKDLEVLDCHDNQLTSIDISKNTKLKKLNCSKNKLKGIDFEKSIELEELKCDNNKLGGLNLTGKNIKLKRLSCRSNKLKKINLDNNINLEELNCSSNELERLDVRKNNQLIELDCSNNRLDALELTGCSELSKINCSDNKIEKLDLQELSNLISLDCEKNKLENLEEVKELDISGEELTGNLELNGFSSLKHLICCDNQLESIDLSDCKQLEIIDCKRNKLKELTFSNDFVLGLKEFRGSDNEFKKLESIIGHIDSEVLNYFDINNINISDCDISDFAKFKKLERLFIGSNDEGKKNVFAGSLESLKELDKLLEIDIRNNDDEEKNKFKDYGQKNDNKHCYVEENKFYDIKALRRSKEASDDVEIKVILRTPLLSADKKNKTDAIKDDYDAKVVDYFESGKLIYPSEKETGFKWETGEKLLSSNLPLRLCYFSSEDKEAEKRLSLGGIKSLDKAIKTLRVLNEFHGLSIKGKEIRYLWMDQLCVNQDNPKEKGHEVSKMRDYYGNATVTLIAIHAESDSLVLELFKKAFCLKEPFLYLCGEKAATPVGWIYYEGEDKKGYSLGDKASLRLNEAL